jgi:hypothetical protein
VIEIELNSSETMALDPAVGSVLDVSQVLTSLYNVNHALITLSSAANKRATSLTGVNVEEIILVTGSIDVQAIQSLSG